MLARPHPPLALQYNLSPLGSLSPSKRLEPDVGRVYHLMPFGQKHILGVTPVSASSLQT